MVINNFNVMGFVILPDKTDTPLVVNPDTHLVLTVTFEGFQTVTGRVFQVICGLRGVQLAQLPQGPVLYIARKSPYFQAIPDFFRILAGK
jgi:hypothetical protein